MDELSFASLLTVVGLAFIVPLVLARFKALNLPVVVGEILAGIVVGRSGLGWVQAHDPVLELLAELGFVFLMFLSGMEIDFSSLGLTRAAGTRPARKGWGPVPLGALSFGLTLVLSTLIGLGFAAGGFVRNPWMMALILSTTSLGVVMPILKERGLIGGRLGQTLMIAAMIADFATMLLITVLVAVLSSGFTLDILLIGLLFVAFFVMYKLGTRFFNRLPGVRRVFEELSQASTQIKVRAAFALMLIFVALSEALGTELILGAFLAGAVLSLLRTPDDAGLGHKLEAIGFGFFIPIFFIMVGVGLNLTALADSPQAIWLVPLLLGAAIVVKLVPALVFRLSFSWRETMAAGVLLSARLSLIIAASAIGLRLEVISESVNAAIILVAILTVTLAPLIFGRLIPHRKSGVAPIVIAGTGEFGLSVAERLKAHGEPVVVISADADGLQRARKRHLEAVEAHMDQPDPAAAPYLEAARAVICTDSENDFNFLVCQVARETYGIDHVVVQVNDPQERLRFEQLGVFTMNPALDRVALFALVGRNPVLYQLITRTDDDKEFAEVVVNEGHFAGQALRQLELPGDLLVLAVHRGGELVVPHGNTQLQRGDRLTVVGSLDAIDAVRRLLVEDASGA